MLFDILGKCAALPVVGDFVEFVTDFDTNRLTLLYELVALIEFVRKSVPIIWRESPVFQDDPVKECHGLLRLNSW